MKLQTQIPLQKQPNNLIDYRSNILLLGSCFVQNIGEKLEYFKFKNLQNPFGIIFNPLAIETVIKNAINRKEYSEQDIFFHNEQWHCFDAHSKLSNASKDDLLSELNKQIELTHQQIHASTHVIITLGTSWVYKHIEQGRYVANCHKIPQKEFSKKLLLVEQIRESLVETIKLISSVNPEASIVFTVSPVRHLKDGFIENTQSKAHLVTAIHQVVKSNKQLYYFPSYEIMMDELRDYRFYKEDMIHPNAIAIEYIWKNFQKVWISETANEIMDEVEYIQKGLLHKPFNPDSERHAKFIKSIDIKKKKLQNLYEYMNFT